MDQRAICLHAELFTCFLDSQFPAVPNVELFGPSGQGEYRFMEVGQAASMRSVQAMEYLQRSYIDLVVPSNKQAVPLPYVVLFVTICFTCIFFLRVPKTLRRTSNLPPGPRGYPVFGSLLRLREARANVVKFTGFVIQCLPFPILTG